VIDIDSSRVSPESFFLSRLFQEFERQKVNYAVMRNHEQLPFSSAGSDLDILVLPEDGLRARAVVLEVIRAAHGSSLGIADSIGFFKIFGLGRTPVDDNWWGVCVDVNVGLYFQGHRLLATDIALPVRTYNGIQVLCDDFASVLGVIKEVLNNKIIPVRYAESARLAAQIDWPRVAALLAPMGQKTLSALHELLVSNAAPEELRSQCEKVRSLFFGEVFFHQPILAISEHLSNIWCKLRRYINPSGNVLAILGVDGAGKSTVINAILPALNAATHNTVIIRHLRPGYLPPLARLKGEKSSQIKPVVAPHASTPSGKFGSLFRLSYLTLDYLIGYWLGTRPKIAKQPTVVIFDRYAYDMALDPRRFRIGVSGRVAGWFAALAPKPDLIICLHGNPLTITARKHELPLEETRRQVEALQDFASREPRAVLISTDGSVEDTRDQVLHAFCNILQSKSGIYR
jgi:thymidylate kinase